ncbi:MAG TPA: DNA repair protein RecN, partial [Blastocatellia bacterium]|nr:DNA repair protein RecN [Blastocatellia bacterium]
RVCRKYGGSEESALCHLYESEKRLENIETAELREKELTADLLVVREDYLNAAFSLSKLRQAAAKRFQQNVVKNLADVALEKARFEVRFQTPSDTETKDQSADAFFAPAGIDQIEFYFSANVGESPRPLGKVASGGEASRLMLILKTTAGMRDAAKTAVFDEIDAGIGGRVAEAVGAKLKDLAADQQVLCVTHQPQVAAQADNHLLVEKTMGKNRTTIGLRPLDDAERIEEIARMLAGETVTEAARENARELLGLRGAEKSISRKI